MLQPAQLRAIQIRHDRLYFRRQHEALFAAAREDARAHPDEECVVYAYAQAVIDRRAIDHYPQVLEAIRRLNQPETMADYYEAHCLAATGQMHEAIDLLLEQPPARAGHVPPNAYAVWLACEYDQPEAAPEIAPDNFMRAAARLLHAGRIDDTRAGRAAMDTLLDQAHSVTLSEPQHVGGPYPAAAAEVTPVEWLIDAERAWGGRLAWLARGRREEFALLAERAGIKSIRVACPIEQELRQQLAAGDIARATATYRRMARACDEARRTYPDRWRRGPIGPCQDVGAAMDACEQLILDETLSASLVLPWYRSVWAPLLDETQSARYRAGIHRAVMARTHSSRARLACAQAYAENGEYMLARRMAWPLLGRAHWAEQAQEIMDACEGALRRQTIRPAAVATQ